MMVFFSKASWDMFKILIIDANASFRKSLKRSLIARFPAVAVQEADSAAEGLYQVDTFAPHLIFIDIYLPDENGLDLARTIKASHLEIIIVIFTRFDSPEYQKAVNDSGIEHLIPKDDWSGKDILTLVESTLLDTKKLYLIKTENGNDKT